MKKLAFLIILGLCSSVNFSQVSVRPGVKLGTNFSTITNTELDLKVGLQTGAFANVRFGSLYALQPEIMYSRQGGKSNTVGENDMKINYLSLVVTNQFFVIPETGFHLMLGPSFDISVGDSLDDFNESPEYSIFDFALFIGVGYEFDFGLVLETRFKHGLIDIDLFGSTNDDRLQVEANVLNSVFQVAAAYKFDF